VRNEHTLAKARYASLFYTLNSLKSVRAQEVLWSEGFIDVRKSTDRGSYRKLPVVLVCLALFFFSAVSIFTVTTEAHAAQQAGGPSVNAAFSTPVVGCSGRGFHRLPRGSCRSF